MVSRHEGLTAVQARKCQRQLRSLPAMLSLGEICGEGERCSSLEALTMLSIPNPPEEYFEIEDISERMWAMFDQQFSNRKQERKRRKEACLKLIAQNEVDWTEVFRQYNSFIDQLANACSCPKSIEAFPMLEALESEIRLQTKQIADAVLSDKSSTVKNIEPKKKAQYIAKLAILQSSFLLWKLCVRLEQRRQAREQMTMLAFALAGYRAEHHGAYPKSLAKLAPNYIDVIPKDPFTDGDFRYRAENGGYLLYSVGNNGKDDGGRGRADYPESVPFEERNEWDDVSIRTPRKKSD